MSLSSVGHQYWAYSRSKTPLPVYDLPWTIIRLSDECRLVQVRVGYGRSEGCCGNGTSAAGAMDLGAASIT